MLTSELCSWWLNFIFYEITFLACTEYTLVIGTVVRSSCSDPVIYLKFPLVTDSGIAIIFNSMCSHCALICLQSSLSVHSTYLLYLLQSNKHLPTLLLQCLKMTGGTVVWLKVVFLLVTHSFDVSANKPIEIEVEVIRGCLNTLQPCWASIWLMM
jgi:hypothetical protein